MAAGSCFAASGGLSSDCKDGCQESVEASTARWSSGAGAGGACRQDEAGNVGSVCCVATNFDFNELWLGHLKRSQISLHCVHSTQLVFITEFLEYHEKDWW